MLRLIQIRKRMGLSQSALARKANLHQPTLCDIEKARNVPWPGQLRAIAAALEWPVDDAAELLEDVDSDAD